MRRSTTIRPAFLLASLLAACGWAGAAERTPSYAPEYFASFQPSTAMDMVAHLPGFVFDDGKAPRGNVLIDGKRASPTEQLGGALGRIPAAGVLRIDLITAGSGDIDLQGYPAIANIVLKSGDLAVYSARVASYLTPDGSLLPSVEANYRLKQRDRNLDLTLNSSTEPDLSQGHGQRSTLRPGAPAAEVAFAGSGSTARKGLRLNYGQELLDGQLNWNGALQPWTYRSRMRFDDERRSAASNDNTGRTLEQGLAYTRALAHDASLDLRAQYRSAETDAEGRFGAGDDQSRNLWHNKTSAQLVAGQLSWRPQNDLVLRGGLESSLDSSDNSGAYLANAAAVAAPSGNSAQQARLQSQWSSAWQLNEAVHAEAGLAIERASVNVAGDSAEGTAHVYSKPLLRLSMSPTPALQLRLRMEREVGQLNLGDAAVYAAQAGKAARAGHPGLEPPQAWLCEGTLEYRFPERGAAALSYTQARISDAVDRMPVRGANAVFDVPGNIGAASTDNLSGWVNLPTDGWAVPQGLVKLSTTWKSSAVTDPLTQTQRRLSGEQPLAWKVEFSQDLPQHRLAWGFALDNGWSNDNWQSAERDANSGGGWASAFVNFRPAPNTTLGLELNNLAGRAIATDRTHYAGDRLAGNIDYVEHSVTHTQPVALLRLRHDW